ncbi:MAG: 4-(cytidine 5'-diphospho)-2-C-methyl-D-erythritol kinase [Oscillatoriophycideae cyanobacterium NC_groundwater_1537_Pr4_S-0.65um_50_18]|nr:4-(cytidine 5'-diphospho)-2-C-methyl-D-erythritol kinase [Oscillatoriophycideae cyanobacterium NC_groundwater_1537_Pr4_S-0.65um_50_18]
MRAYSLIAPAKINLYLEIIGDRSDGYHELAMILQSIALSDRVDLRANGTDQIRVRCDDPLVPSDASNLAYRAADLIVQQFPESYRKFGGVDIAIEKRIPMGAGLAGGSANAAAVLVGLDLMWSLGLTQPELQDLAAQLGSDIPFCIAGGTAIATGRGEQLAPLPSPEHLHVVLAKYRSIAISTPWAYKAYRQQFGHSYISDPAEQKGRKQQMHSGAMVGAIAQRDGKRIGQLLHNDLEKVVLPTHPKVAELRQTLEKMNPLGVMMSGSGSTVFALVESSAQAEQIHQQLSAEIPDPDLGIWKTHLTASGVQVVS